MNKGVILLPDNDFDSDLARGEASQSRKSAKLAGGLEVSRGAPMPARRANLNLTLRVRITS